MSAIVNKTGAFGRHDLLPRGRFLASTALVAFAVWPLPFFFPGSALAACNVVGTGTIGTLNSNDVATCTGVGNTDNVAATNQTNVTVNIGTGAAAASLTPPAGSPVNFNNTTFSFITVNNQGTIQNADQGINLQNASTDNTITIEFGGLVEVSSVGAAAITVQDSNANSIEVSGTLFGNGGSTMGVSFAGTATINTIIVAGSGVINATDGIYMGVGGNGVISTGTITGTNIGILGSNGEDSVFSGGVISGGSGTAIDFGDGNDILTLQGGYTNIGRVLGGNATDTLRFAGTADGTFNLNDLGPGQQYDQFEELVKSGPRIWTLTGTTTFNGPMTVNAGRLVVNGTLPSIVTINGGSLGGNSTIGGLIVNNGGTIAPGNSIGTTTVTGNAVFNAGATYQVEVAPNGASDLIDATGTATINGGTVQIIPLGVGFVAGTKYTIVTAAGGVTGVFDALAPLTSPLVAGQLTYDANNAYFLLQQVAGFGTLSGLTPNQFAAGTALDQAMVTGASGALSTANNTLAALNTQGIKSGLDDLAGQVLADSRRFSVDQAGAFHNFMWKAGTQSRGESLRVSTPLVSSYAPTPQDPIGKALRSAEPRYDVWYGAYGSWDRVFSNDIAFGTNTALGGAALGVEFTRGPDLAAGVAIGASSGKLSASGRADLVTAEAGHAALYARGDAGGINVASAISYSFAALEASRSIGFLQQTAEGAWRANTFGASLGISRPYQVAGVTAEPFAHLDWYSTRHGGFTETGAPGVNQVTQAGRYNLLTGTVGLRLVHDMVAGNAGPAKLGATLGVRHDLVGSAPAMTTAFEGAPAVPFEITGIERPRTTFIAGAEALWALTPSTAFKAAYEGGFATDRAQHSVQATIRTAL